MPDETIQRDLPPIEAVSACSHRSLNGEVGDYSAITDALYNVFLFNTIRSYTDDMLLRKTCKHFYHLEKKNVRRALFYMGSSIISHMTRTELFHLDTLYAERQEAISIAESHANFVQMSSNSTSACSRSDSLDQQIEQYSIKRKTLKPTLMTRKCRLSKHVRHIPLKNLLKSYGNSLQHLALLNLPFSALSLDEETNHGEICAASDEFHTENGFSNLRTLWVSKGYGQFLDELHFSHINEKTFSWAFVAALIQLMNIMTIDSFIAVACFDEFQTLDTLQLSNASYSQLSIVKIDEFFYQEMLFKCPHLRRLAIPILKCHALEMHVTWKYLRELYGKEARLSIFRIICYEIETFFCIKDTFLQCDRLHLPHLEKLNLRVDCSLGLMEFDSPNIKHIELRLCGHDNFLYVSISDDCTNLKKLSLIKNNLTGKIFAILPKQSKSLQRLNFENSDDVCETWQRFSQYRALEKLVVIGHTIHPTLTIPDAMMLKVIHIHYFNVTSLWFPSDMPHLVNLHIGGSKLKSIVFPVKTPSLMKIVLKKCHRIRQLCLMLDSSKLSSIVIADCHQLEVFVLKGQYPMLAEFLIRDCRELHAVEFYCIVKPGIILNISNCVKLKEITDYYAGKHLKFTVENLGRKLAIPLSESIVDQSAKRAAA